MRKGQPDCGPHGAGGWREHLPLDVLRLAVDVQVQPAQVLPHDAQRQELHAAENEDGDDRRSVARHADRREQVRASGIDGHDQPQQRGEQPNQRHHCRGSKEKLVNRLSASSVSWPVE